MAFSIGYDTYGYDTYVYLCNLLLFENHLAIIFSVKQLRIFLKMPVVKEFYFIVPAYLPHT